MKQITSSYPISPADPNHHLMAIAKMVAIAFTNGEYIEEIANNYIGNCHYDWDTSRLIWDGERLIHHWGVWGYPMRLESVQLQVAGVGAVATDEEYRSR